MNSVTSWNPSEIVELYRAGGWWEMGCDPSQIPRLLEGSFFVLVATDEKGNAVGIGRLISDGASDCFIQDVVVFQDYRHQGIGRRIVEALKKYAILTGHTWIGLVALPGKEDFYKHIGFSIMENYTPMLKQ